MNRDELTRLIYSDEGPKLDFKRQSWNLDTKEGKGEFIKDILAMTNAFGTIGYLIVGVGDEPSRPLASIENQGLSEERLQQIVKEYVEPPIEFIYGETNLHGKTIGVVIIPASKGKPHWAKKRIGALRDRTFYIRRGSTTDLATLSELEQMIRERPLASEPPYGGWSVELLWNRKEHIRLVPCLFLEKWEQERTNVMSTDEIREAIEARTGKHLRPQGAGNLVGSFNQKAAKQGLSPLFVQVEDKIWRLPKKYLELVKKYCRTYALL
jgi:hypothetical protein